MKRGVLSSTTCITLRSLARSEAPVSDPPTIFPGTMRTRRRSRARGRSARASRRAKGSRRRRFPGDFAFQLTQSEYLALVSRLAASDPQAEDSNRSQFAAGSQKDRDPRPWAFTEHGALMAANVLRSERAVRMSVYVIRAFVRLRDIYRKLLPLLQPPPDPPKRPIGFRSRYEPAKAWRLPLRPGSELEGSRGRACRARRPGR
jgi:hypothetical protein